MKSRESFEVVDQSWNSVFEKLYDDLHIIAAREIASEKRKRSGFNSLRATELLHEAWIRLSNESAPSVDKVVFRHVTVVMHRILIERARYRNAEKRGGGTANRISIDAYIEKIEETLHKTLNRTVPEFSTEEFFVEFWDALDQLRLLDSEAADFMVTRLLGQDNKTIAEKYDVIISVVKQKLKIASAFLEDKLFLRQLD